MWSGREDDLPVQPDRGGLVLAIASLGCGIPITGAAGGTPDVPGAIVAWIGIVLVNTAYAIQSRRSNG